MSELDAKRERLLAIIAGYESCVVALSAGVDSTVVAQAARIALGDRALAVTGASASLAQGELEEARAVARQIGIRHEVVETSEFESAAYTQNAPDRCYHCKTELYTRLEPIAARFGAKVIANGANLDDQGDYRPGMIAAGEHAVRSPLAEAGFTKADVRSLAAEWGLSTWDKPASPCLSSRVAYGEEVTPERLSMIDAAERYLRSLGLAEARVRYHKGDLARIEAPPAAIARLSSDEVRPGLVAHLRSLGFKFVSIDLEGFRSGSLNQVLAPELLRVLK